MQVTRTRRSILTTALAAALTVGGLTACSDDGAKSAVATEAPPPPEVAKLLDRAIDVMDAARTARFTVAGTGVPKDAGKSRMLDGEGVMSRPTPTTAAFDGDLTVLISGQPVKVSVISFRNQLYVRTGENADFQASDPTAYGMIDPASFIKTRTGIPRLLTDLKNITDGGTATLGDGTEAHVVKGTITGLLAARLLPIADPYSQVQVTLSIDPVTAQLRQSVIAGHFFDNSPTTTYVVKLYDYDKKVVIKAPEV